MRLEKCLPIALPVLLALTNCAQGSTLGTGGDGGSGGTSVSTKASGPTTSADATSANGPSTSANGPSTSANGPSTSANGPSAQSSNAATSVQASSAVTSVQASVAASSSSGMMGNCDPLSPSAVCGASMHCFPQASGTPVCAGPTGAGGPYSACSTPADCVAADQCVDTGDPFALPCCLSWCASDLDCPGSTCTFLSPAVYVGATQYGVCFDGLGGC